MFVLPFQSHTSLCHLSEQEALLENVSLRLRLAWFAWFRLVSNCFISGEIGVMLLFRVGFYPTLLLCEHFLQLFAAGKM